MVGAMRKTKAGYGGCGVCSGGEGCSSITEWRRKVSMIDDLSTDPKELRSIRVSHPSSSSGSCVGIVGTPAGWESAHMHAQGCCCLLLQ